MHHLKLSLILLLFIINVYSSETRAPILSIKPENYFSENEPLKLSCKATGIPKPVITWHAYPSRKLVVSGKDNIKVTFSDGTSTLEISSPRKKHLYEFYCNASNKYGEIKSEPVSTGVPFLESVFEVSPPKVKETLSNHFLKLSCKAPRGIPLPNITWYRVDPGPASRIEQVDPRKPQFRGFHVTIDSLSIPRPQVKDSGTYRCIARNNFFPPKTVETILLVKNTNVKTKDFNFKLGSKANISCPLLNSNYYQNTQIGLSLPPVNWYRLKRLTNNTTSQRVRGSIIGNRMLQIPSIQSDDAGIYKCKMQGQEALVNVSVHEKIQFVETPDDKTVSEGSDVVFRCVIRGLPTPTVYWYSPRGVIHSPKFTSFEPSSSQFFLASNGVLTIKGVTMKDAGKYVCVVHNSIGVKQTSVKLIVKRRDLTSYPIISFAPQNQTLPEGGNVMFRCKVTSPPNVRITWYKEGRSLDRSKDKRMKKMRHGVFQISDIKADRDSGQYTCQAQLPNRPDFYTRWTATLKVVSKNSKVGVKAPVNLDSLLPKPPVLAHPKIISATSMKLDWTSSQDHSIRSANQTYWVEMVEFGSTTKVGWQIYKYYWPQTSIIISDLTPGKYYQFLVRAHNQYGLSRASVPTEYKRMSEEYTGEESLNSKEVLNQFSNLKIESFEINTMKFGKIDVKLYVPLSRTTKFNLIRRLIKGIRIFYNLKPISQCMNAYFRSPELMSSTQDCSVNFLTSNPNIISFLESSSAGQQQKWWSNTDPRSRYDLDEPMKNSLSRGVLTVRTPLVFYKKKLVLQSVLSGLNEFSCYEFRAQVYSSARSIVSKKSKPKLALMKGKIASESLIDVQSTWNAPSTLVIQFRLPSIHTWHGVPKAIIIRLIPKVKRYSQRINDRKQYSFEHKLDYSNFNSTDVPDQKSTHRINLRDVAPNFNYTLIVSILNCHGEGARSLPIFIPAISTVTSAGTSNQQGSWFIPVTVIATLLFWILLCCLVIYLCCVRCRHGNLANGIHGNGLVSKGVSGNKDILYQRQPPPLPLTLPLTTTALTTHVVTTTPSDALYSTTSMLNGASNHGSSCTPYASASIIDAISPNSNYYQQSDLTQFGTSITMAAPPPPPPYLTYAPYNNNSVTTSNSSSGTGGTPPSQLLMNNTLTSTGNTTMNHHPHHSGVSYPSVTSTINTYNFTQLFGTMALTQDDNNNLSHTSTLLPSQQQHQPLLYANNTLLHHQSLKMGLLSQQQPQQQPHNVGISSNSSHTTSSSHTTAQKQPQFGGTNCSVATLGSTPPSLSGGLVSDGSNNHANMQGMKCDDSPKSTVHYDIIPTTEGSNYDDDDDDRSESDDDADDDTDGESYTEQDDEDDEDDGDESPILKDDDKLTKHKSHNQGHSTLPSIGNTSSDTYSSVAMESSIPQKRKTRRKANINNGISISKHLRQSKQNSHINNNNRIFLQNSKL